MIEGDVTQRFGDRVEDYQRYRPDYPPQLVEWLHRDCGVSPSWEVADIGAGTGISAKLFLDAGHRVVAVEPNGPMRAAAERWLGGHEGFRSVGGRAEDTALPAASVDLVIVAQAFHWFDRKAVRAEFARILRPGGRIAVFWNSRRLQGTPFLEGYERLLREYGTDYAAVAERYADDDAMRAWFGAGFLDSARFEHHQYLDLDGLRGRLLSSSYAPPPGHPNHEPMLKALAALYEGCAVDGAVDMRYDTRVFAGAPA